MHRSDLERRALRLQWVTVAWNVFESGVTIALGIGALSLALIGFGTDSLIEVFTSLVVVWHLTHPDGGHPRQTARALRLIAGAFLLLSVGLAAVSITDLVRGRRPEETIAGIVILVVVVAVMFTLAFLKRRIADRLGSAPLKAEATMSLLDGFLATATLAGLALHATLGWWWADPAAALVVAAAAVNEARENWEEAAEVLEG
jgi:divalent metal cation (Fe/Co/Zn/Cd) transporter